MTVLEQLKQAKEDLVKSLELLPKLEPIIGLSEDQDKIITEWIDDLNMEAMLTKPTKFIREDEYLENLLDDLLNNDDILDEDLTTVANVRIIPLEFTD